MTPSIDMPGIGFISFDAIAAAIRIADSTARSDIECECTRDALVRDDRFPQLVKFKEKT